MIIVGIQSCDDRFYYLKMYETLHENKCLDIYCISPSIKALICLLKFCDLQFVEFYRQQYIC